MILRTLLAVGPSSGLSFFLLLHSPAHHYRHHDYHDHPHHHDHHDHPHHHCHHGDHVHHHQDGGRPRLPRPQASGGRLFPRQVKKSPHCFILSSLSITNKKGRILVIYLSHTYFFIWINLFA